MPGDPPAVHRHLRHGRHLRHLAEICGGRLRHAKPAFVMPMRFASRGLRRFASARIVLHIRSWAMTQ